MIRRPLRWTWMAATATALAFTAWLYARPETVILLAEQLWACF